MGKATDRRRDVESRAEEVLAAGAAPSASALIELIHEVNPTSRALPARVEERRYALKDALQSLLIRLFGDALSVQPGPAGSPDVGLRHRYLGLDACHARLEALDDDARAWVRLQLDLGTPEHEAEVRERGGDEALDDTPLGLVRRGRAAMRAYDYEGAEALLRDAFTRSGGASFAAAALFELLVDTLAQDEAALALTDDLSRTARTQPAVRGALALAAARTGRLAEAEAWLENAAGARAAEALAHLAREALAKNELDRAATFGEALATQDPAHPELVAIREAVAKQRAEEEKPLVEARRKEQQARAEAMARRLAEADTAERAGDLEGAARAYVEARERGAEVTEQLAAVQRKMGERAREATVAKAAQALRATAGVAELVLWGSLDADGRAEARRRIGEHAAALLATMEEIGLDRGHSHVKSAAEATLALVEAEAACADGRAEHALALLHPHERLLSRVREARRVLEVAGGMVRRKTEAERGRRKEELAQTEAASRQARRAERCRGHRAAAMQAANMSLWGHAGIHGRMARRFDDDPTSRSAWDEQLAVWARSHARATFAVVTVEGAEADGSHEEWNAFFRLGRMSRAFLVEEGRALFGVTGFDREVFAIVLDVATRRIVRRLRWRLAEDFDLAEPWVRGDGAFLLGKQGQLVEVCLRDGGVRRSADIERLLWPERDGQRRTPGRTSGSIVAPRGSELLWLTHDAEGTIAFDPETWDIVCRDRGRYLDPEPLPLDTGTLVAALPSFDHALLRRADGHLVTDPLLPQGRRIHDVAVRPDGKGIVALHSAVTVEEDGAWSPDRAGPVLLRAWGADGLVEEDLGADAAEDGFVVATSRTAGLVFVRSRTKEGDGRLRAFRVGTAGFERVWDVPVPRTAELAKHEGAREVVLLVSREEMLVTLGAEPPPPFSLRHRLPDLEWPELVGEWTCAFDAPPTDHMATDMIRDAPDDSVAIVIRDMRRRKAPPEEVVGWVNRLLWAGPGRVENPRVAVRARELVELALELHPEDPLVRFSAAQLSARAGAWPRAEALLRELPWERLPPRGREHALHLMGAVRFVGGDFAGARKIWERGEGERGAHGQDCRFSLLGGLARVMETPLRKLRPEEQPNDAQDTLARCRLADAALARNAPADAFEVLSGMPATALELQSAARYAAAALTRPAPSETDRFRTAFALARFLFVRRERERATGDIRLRPELHLGPATWNRERIEALAAEAQTWLDAFGKDAGAAGAASAG